MLRNYSTLITVSVLTVARLGILSTEVREHAMFQNNNFLEFKWSHISHENWERHFNAIVGHLCPNFKTITFGQSAFFMGGGVGGRSSLPGRNWNEI